MFGQPGAIDVSDASGQKLSPDQVVAAGGALFQGMCAECRTPNKTTGAYETMRTFAQPRPGQPHRRVDGLQHSGDTGQSGRLTGIKTDYGKQARR